jgi:prepilin-type N-terminal cleavage/methylation domain-containing protein
VETTMQSKGAAVSTSRRREEGFTLFEMIIAMLVVTIGLLAVAQSIGYALMASNSGRGITNAKLLVVSALEQMESLRDTGQLNFNEISNTGVSGSSFPGFSTNFLPVSTVPGPDGIYGTADDLSTDPGLDGIYGTADDITDQTRVVKGATRQVLINNLSPTLKRIQVTLRYSANGGSTRDLVGVSYLNDDAHGNYVP